MTRSQLQKRDVFVIVTGLVGVILFWRGIWEASARYFSPEVSLGIGVALLALLALVERKRFWKLLS